MADSMGGGETQFPPLFAAGTSSKDQAVVLVPIYYENGDPKALANLIRTANIQGYDYRKTVRTQCRTEQGQEGPIYLFHLFIKR